MRLVRRGIAYCSDLDAKYLLYSSQLISMNPGPAVIAETLVIVCAFCIADGLTAGFTLPEFSVTYSVVCALTTADTPAPVPELIDNSTEA
jgi:hypothetical protein